jgi:hypothetical protein
MEINYILFVLILIVFFYIINTKINNSYDNFKNYQLRSDPAADDERKLNNQLNNLINLQNQYLKKISQNDI